MADVDRILFSEPFRTGRESDYLGQVLASTTWHGDGPFTERSSRWLEDFTGARHSLLTTSGTHALELASILLDLGPGDEVGGDPDGDLAVLPRGPDDRTVTPAQDARYRSNDDRVARRAAEVRGRVRWS